MLEFALKIALFGCVCVACPALGYMIAYVAEPRHDVEWVFLSVVLMLLGMVIGPILGCWAMKLVFRS